MQSESDLGKLQHGESQIDRSGQRCLHGNKLALMFVDLCLPLRKAGLFALALHQLCVSEHPLHMLPLSVSFYGTSS